MFFVKEPNSRSHKWISKKCLHCKIQMTGPRSSIKNRKYCSYECAALRRTKKQLAERKKNGWKASSDCLRVRRYRANNAEKLYCHREVARAIRFNELEKNPACAVRACTDTGHYHHEDYSRPTDVISLCPAHHKARHSLSNRGQLPLGQDREKVLRALSVSALESYQADWQHEQKIKRAKARAKKRVFSKK